MMKAARDELAYISERRAEYKTYLEEIEPRLENISKGLRRLDKQSSEDQSGQA